MAEELKDLGVKNIGLFLVGVILLVIGLGASFYNPVETEGTSLVEYPNPYQGIAVVLFGAGIIFMALEFLYPTQKTQPQKTEPQPQQA